MKHSLGIVMLMLSLLAGCAGGPPRVQPPVPAEARDKGVSAVHAPVLDETNHMTVHLDRAGEIIYFQSFGNSAAVGVLFGPLGVLANVAVTKAVTDADISQLKDRLTVEPGRTFQAAASEAGLSLSAQRLSGGVNLSPYLYLVKLSDGKVLPAAALVVEAPTPDALIQAPRYLYQLPLQYTVDTLGQAGPAITNEITRELQIGYGELIRFYLKDRPEAMNRERLVRFRSDFLNPRFEFEAPGKIAGETPQRIWIRHALGIAAVQRSNIKVLGPWE